MTGLTTYSDTADSYDAGYKTARREAFWTDDDQRQKIVDTLREWLAAESTNRYARAYAEGALDAMAPFGLYA